MREPCGLHCKPRGLRVTIFQKFCFGTSESKTRLKLDFLLRIYSKWVVFAGKQVIEMKFISGMDRTVRLSRKIARYDSEKPVIVLKTIYQVNKRLLKPLLTRECPRRATIWKSKLENDLYLSGTLNRGWKLRIFRVWACTIKVLYEREWYRRVEMEWKVWSFGRFVGDFGREFRRKIEQKFLSGFSFFFFLEEEEASIL